MRPPQRTGPADRQTPSVLFVINVDWFFLSHFVPFAAEAQRRGWRCLVACEVSEARAQLAAAGLEVLPLNLTRGARRLGGFWRAAGALARLIEAHRPDVVHAIGLEAVVVAGLARLRSPACRFVFAPTGLGYAGVRSDWKGRLARLAIPAVLTRLGGRGAGWIFENRDDAARFGIGRSRPDDVLVVGGAGVDVERFRPVALPPSPPLRVAQVSRMIWSKGPDLAVAAVAALRNAGLPVELTLVGDADPFNPRPLGDATLRSWTALPGVRWAGRQTDIPAIWASHHVACLPSRGGEGLPKSLIEAAACGRAVVTTDVPGCRALVADGQEGFVVAPDDASALAAALRRFLDQPDLIGCMGAAARRRVLAEHADHYIAGCVVDFYGPAGLRRT